jgi:hypothetical protein
MNNNEINTAIKYLNEALQSDILDPVKYDINLNIIAAIIDKKKNNLKNFLFLGMNQKNINSPQNKSKYSQNNSESLQSNNKSEDNTTTHVDDSISVTNFNIPSEVFIPTSNTSNDNDTWKTLTNPREF